MIEGAQYTLGNIVDIGKVPAVFTVVEHLDRLSFENSFCKEEKRHIGPPPRPVYGKKTKSCCRNTIEVTVSMRHQFIRLFCRSIKRQRVINIVMNGKRHGLIRPVNRTRRGVHQMFDMVLPTPLEEVHEAENIAVNIGMGVLDRVADTCLCSEIHHTVKLFNSKKILHPLPVGKIQLYKPEIFKCPQYIEAGLFQSNIVIVIEVVYADNFITALKQAGAYPAADKTG